MTSTQTNQKTFKVGDRVVFKTCPKTVTTVTKVHAGGAVDIEMFSYSVSSEGLTLYVEPSETKTDGVFQIGDKVQVKETGRVFVISDAKFTANVDVPWFKPSDLEHYTKDMELADIDKQIMKLIETKAKLINETKK